MNLFTITQLQQYSGIKAHTIRIWEQRYDALNPSRSKGNTRYYDNEQLRRLLNIVSLLETGHKVSELCTLSDQKLFLLIEKNLIDAKKSDTTNDYYISQLLAASFSFDEIYFDKIFSNCVLKYGLKNTYIEVIYPLLNRIGLMWTASTLPPAYEHFISNIIKQKLYSAIDALAPNSSKSTWLLLLPENEFHVIGLLMSNYILRQSGKKVIYLGANVPLQTLNEAVEKIAPHHIHLFFVHHDIPEQIQDYLDTLIMNFKKIKIHISGNENLIQKLNLETCNWIRSIDDLEKQIEY